MLEYIIDAPFRPTVNVLEHSMHRMLIPTLGKYHLVEKLGEGGMAEVYKALDPDLEITVAIKVLKANFSRDPLVNSKFVEEARTAAKLRHQHIVRIMGFNQDGTRSFIVMEYLSGKPLSLLAPGDGLSLTRAVSVIEQLADALDYIHKRNLVHQDVKPANVIVGDHDFSVLTDFGIVRALVPGQSSRSGAIIGSAMYMAPEQVKDEPISTVTDVYCLGVVAYELITGRAPFVADNLHAVMHMQAYETPPPMSTIRAGIPKSVEREVLRALAKKQTSRPDSASAFAAELRRAVDGMTSSHETPPRDHVRKVRDKQRYLTRSVQRTTLGTMPLVGALAAIAVVTGLIFGINRGVTEPQRRLAQAIATATAVAMHASTMVSPTSGVVEAAGVAVGPLPESEFQATITTLAADGANAVATIVSLQTEVATTATPVPLPTAVARASPVAMRTSQPISGPSILLAPVSSLSNGMVRLGWSVQGTLPEGAIFDVQVCKGETCAPVLGKTNTRETSWVWCPDSGEGTYGWKVETIRSGNPQKFGSSSNIGTFQWSGGCGAEEDKSKECEKRDPHLGICLDQ